MTCERTLRLTVAWITRHVQDVVPVEVPVGSTLADALAASRLVETYGLDPAQLSYAVAGKRLRIDSTVHDGDRIDVLRPLIADPKDARRRRAARQGAIQQRKRQPGK